MAKSPQYTDTPKNGTTQVTTANTNLDGSGALVDVYTAGTLGARIDQITINAVATTTAGMIRLYISDTADHRLIKEVPVTVVTPSASNPAFSVVVDFEGGLILEANNVLKASTQNTETFNITPTQAGDF